MAKGENCPSCGAQTWHRGDRGGRNCSSCGLRGWLPDDSPTGGGGKGNKCGHCENQTLVRVDSVTPEVRFCTSCKAIAIQAPVNPAY
jgi:hypothetical protein